MTHMLFKDAFWGKEFTIQVGYDALIQRLSDGRRMCKDVEELLKMRALAEERYGKELLTIANKAGGNSEIGTMRASFDHLKAQIENIGNFHIQLSGVLREEIKKIEIFRGKQKTQRKKFELIMEKVQKTKVSVFKKTMESKKNYDQKCREADDAEQSADKPSNANCTPKQTQKVNQRITQCRNTAKEAERLYLANIDNLDSIRRDWEETHRGTCEVFQQLETDRISILRCSLWDHCNHFSMQCVKDDELYEEVRKILEKCDTTTDNNRFIEMKSTGSSPPEPIKYKEYHSRDPSENINGRVRSTDGIPRRYSMMQLGSSRTNIIGSSHSLPSTGQSAEGGYASISEFQKKSSVAVEENEDNYVVVYNYFAQNPDEMSVTKGDTVQMLEQGEDGWWTVTRNGQVGLVPGNYLARNHTLDSL